MTRNSFPKFSQHRSEEILNIVHIDVCGPMQIMTPGKKPYILTMIDDYSRYTMVYLIGHKSEVPDKIREYIKAVKTKFKVVSKVIHSDERRKGVC